MTHKLAALLFIPFAISATQAVAGSKWNCLHHGPGEDIYKHYTGTIGTKKVSLDFRYGYCGASNYGGSYFYEEGSNQLRGISIYEPATFNHNETLHATEYISEDHWGDGFNDGDIHEPNWEFTIQDNRLTGKWVSADGKTTSKIDLSEDYTNAVRFDVAVYEDSAKTMKPGQAMRSAEYTYIGVKPSANVSHDDAYFIVGQMLKLTGADAMGANDLDIMPSSLAQKNFGLFSNEKVQVPADTSKPNWRSIYNSHYFNTIFPLYNDNGILAIENRSYNNSSMPVSYINIDVSRKRALTLNNVLTIDKDKLINIIQTEYKSKLRPGAKDVIGVNKIDIPENFVVMGKGIIFCYTYDSDGYSDGLKHATELRIYIPYTKLTTMLNKDFARRMKLG